jgi:hypothetical protein
MIVNSGDHEPAMMSVQCTPIQYARKKDVRMLMCAYHYQITMGCVRLPHKLARQLGVTEEELAFDQLAARHFS